MTTADATYILAILKVAYPGSFSKLTAEDAKATVELWAAMFADEPRDVVAAAVKAIMLEQPEREFAPPIGMVKHRILKFSEPEQLTAQEAWQLVSRATAHCDLQHPSREFEKLPPAVQRAVGSANQLRDWGLVDEDTFQTVIGSNFRRIWETQQKREEAQRALPSELSEFISGLADRLALPE